MSFIPEKIQITCQQLRMIADRKLSEITGLEYVKAEGYKQGNVPPRSGWQPFEPGMRVNGRDSHFWFQAAFRTPACRPGCSVFARCTTGYEGQWDSINPQGLIYLNGEMAQGCDTNHTEIYLEPDTEYVLHNYLYMGLYENSVPLRLELYERDEEADALYFDMKTALDTCMLLDQNSDEYIRMMSVLEQTANRIDLRVPGDARCAASIREARDYIQKKLYQDLCSTEGKPVVDCVGHTHIDVEYLWARNQTREKIQRSFATAAALMKRYPEYRFMLSQPELYRYLKEEAPEKYQELKQLVREGRWEPEGAMWVESDCNLVSGESFIRQILQGMRFFKKEFGVECKILFLPDVFGYSSALPQILKKCGIRHFITSKISWNETNTMPLDCFLWQGIDGTEIFTNFMTTQDYTGPKPERGTVYAGLLNPSQIKGTWNKFLQKEYCSHVLTTFGYGDGGGGPTREMLETQRRLAKGLPGMPVTRMEGLLAHLDQARTEFDAGCRETRRTPRWVGELYLEFHRGTYTSMAKNKRNNRKSEFMLQKTEALSYTSLLQGGSYDWEGLDRTWNLVLHNQFHDIIPGSAIKEVYDGTDCDYRAVFDYCSGKIREKLSSLAAGVSTDGGLLVYNSLGFPRQGTVQRNGKTAELLQPIPAFGWTVVKSFRESSEVQLSGLTAENRFYRLTLDKAGRIAELWDKQAGRQVLKQDCPGNELQAFEDFPRKYDNWEITDYYKQKMWILEDAADIRPVTVGSRSGFRIERKYLNSHICQTVWLYSESRRIDFETDIDWHEHHQLLKAAFLLDVHASSATYEIQFGHVQRPTHENTSWDRAKFEVYGHKWVDLSENGYGVSLLNDCKYGYSTEGSTLKLTMLKCGTYPNPEADQGMHHFTYALLPHRGDFREAGIIREAYAMNQPLDYLEVPASRGTLPETYSLISCDQENIVIETVKKAEADDGMIVRLYDAFDRRENARIRVAGGFRRAWICDMMEKPITEAALTENQLVVPVSNFEIVTLKLEK